MMLVRVGDYLNELKTISPDIYKSCVKAFSGRVMNDGDLQFTEEGLNLIERVSVERQVLENSGRLSMVRSDFGWTELTSIEDLQKFDYKNRGPAVTLNSEGSLVVNKSETSAVVVSGLKDAVVVNTDDAVFVGARGQSSTEDLKKLLGGGPDTQTIGKYINGSNIHYRQWGYYKELEISAKHYVRHIFVSPGRTIYEHAHEKRTENWIIVSGKALVTIDSTSRVIEYSQGSERRKGRRGSYDPG